MPKGGCLSLRLRIAGITPSLWSEGIQSKCFVRVRRAVGELQQGPAVAARSRLKAKHRVCHSRLVVNRVVP